MNFLKVAAPVIALLMLFSRICLAADPEESYIWQSHWFDAIDNHLNGKYEKAITEYTLAIEILQEKGTTNAYLYYDRGQAYIDKQDFNNAITDFSKVIDSQNVSAYNKANAYRLRGQAYLLTRKLKEFEKDALMSMQLDPLKNILEGDQFATFRVGYNMLTNQSLFDAMKRTFLIAHIIDSEDDMVLLPSGTVILKKANGCPADIIKKEWTQDPKVL